MLDKMNENNSSIILESKKSSEKKISLKAIGKVPWMMLLASIPTALFIYFAVYLANNPQIVIATMNRPYSFLFVVAIVVGIVVILVAFHFLAAIQKIVQIQIKKMQEKTDSFLFNLVIICFMIMSVIESGPFFAGMLKNDFAGYFIVFVFDLSAVLFMNKRKTALFHGNDKLAFMHMLGVFMTAGISGFANAYSSLENYVTPTTGKVPVFMTHIAPWTGIVFPTLIIFIATTLEADHDGKNIVERYKEEQQLRIDYLKEKVAKTQLINAELEQLELLKKKSFFLIELFFTKKKVLRVIDTVTKNMQQQIQLQISEGLKNQQFVQAYDDSALIAEMQLLTQKVQVYDAKIQQIAAAVLETRELMPQIIEAHVQEIKEGEDLILIAERVSEKVFQRLLPSVKEDVKQIESPQEQLQLPENTVSVEEVITEVQEAIEEKQEETSEEIWEVKRLKAKDVGYKAAEKQCKIGSYTFAKLDTAATLLKSKKITTEVLQKMYDQRLIDPRLFRIVETKGWGTNTYEHILIAVHPDVQKIVLEKMRSLEK